MKSQFYPDRAAHLTLRFGEPLRLAGGGDFVVLSGSAWVTRDGDLDDHVLEAGDTFSVTGADGVVAEAWRSHEPTRIAWRPRHQPPGTAVLRRGAAALGLRLA